LQSSQPLVHQAEEPLERIGRTQFDMDTPDADGQTSRNLKEDSRLSLRELAGIG
jgi:hypothetical protein